MMDEDGVVMRLATRTLQSTIVGAVSGATLGFFRSQSVGWYTTTMGLNFAICGGAFFATREVLEYVDVGEPIVTSGLAGGLAGGALTWVHAGGRKAIPGALLWAGVACLGHVCITGVSDWRQAEAQRVMNERAVRAGMTPAQIAARDAEQARQPSRWLRMERTTIDFDKANHKARAKDPTVRPDGRFMKPMDAVGEGGGEDNEGGGWLDSLPSWLPIAKLEEGEHLAKLRRRLDVVEMMLAAHQEAVVAEEGDGAPAEAVASPER